MDLCQEVREALLARAGSGSCTPTDEGGVFLGLPLTYRDGDVVEVLVERRGDLVYVSDAGETLGRLDQAGVDVRADWFQDSLERQLKGYGVSTVEDELIVIGSTDHLARLVMDLAAAAISTDALEVLRSTQEPRTFPREVLEYLNATVPFVQERPELVGVSGRSYFLTAGTQHADGAPITYVQALPSSGKAASSPMEHALRIFVDVGERVPVERRLVLLRGAPEQYAAPDLRLLMQYAHVGTWTSKRRLGAWLNTPVEERDPEQRLLASTAQTSF